MTKSCLLLASQDDFVALLDRNWLTLYLSKEVSEGNEWLNYPLSPSICTSQLVFVAVAFGRVIFIRGNCFLKITERVRKIALWHYLE